MKQIFVSVSCIFLQVTHISPTMTTQDTRKNASQKRPALNHDHHDNHHQFRSEHNHAAAASHEDHDGIDFQIDHHHHHRNINDQYDQHQHQHQHQHHMDDDRSQQSESNDHHCLNEELNEDGTNEAVMKNIQGAIVSSEFHLQCLNTF